MSLQDIVNSVISENTSNPTRPGFGTPIVVGYHTHNTDRLRYYSSLTALAADGHTTTGPIYLAASVLLAQNPSVPKFGVGRRASPPLQVLNLTCTSATAGDTYAAVFVDNAGTSHTLTYTSTGVPATDAAAIATLITAFALSGCTVTHSSAVITLTQTAGHLVDVQGPAGTGVGPGGINGTGVHNFTLADVTADPGLAADLAAILAADGTGWYGFGLESNSPAESLIAAAFAESNKRTFSCNVSDTLCGTATTGHVGASLKALSYAHTHILFSQTKLLSFSGLGIMGNRFPSNPGSDTWDLKTILGVPVDALSETQTTNLAATNMNWYQTIASINVTQNGVCPGGEYMDVVRFIDWLNSNIQIDVFQLLVSLPKVPYTDIGIDMIANCVKNRLKIGASKLFGGIDGARPIIVTAPTADSVDAGSRAARILPGIAWSAFLSGAIQTVNPITGSLS